MPDPTYYCTSDDVRRASGRAEAYGTEEAAAVAAWIPRAHALIDELTGTWFDTRSKVITTEAIKADQVKLFLPAPLITLDSLVEDEVELDFTDDFISYGMDLEKVDRLYWSPKQQSIIITGTFGRAAIPGQITEACAEIAAIMGGLKSRTAIDGAGITQSLTVNSLPDWVKGIIQRNTRPDFHGQLWSIADGA